MSVSSIGKARERARMTQAALAAKVGVSRQSVVAIEAGRSRPAVDLALRIAAALDVTVEDLFGRPPRATTPPVALGTLTGSSFEGPAVLGRVGERWVAHADPSHGARPADAWVKPLLSNSHLPKQGVEWLADPDDLGSQLLVAGCAPALGALARRLEQGGRGPRAAWLPWSSQRSFDALAAGEVHVAGVHLEHDNAELIAADPRLVFVTLARWPVGLAFRRDDRRVRSPADLARARLRVAAREQGAGARRLLDRTLRTVGATLRGRGVRVASHDEAAQAVALGAADVCVTGADVAKSHGLSFLQLAEERFDLVTHVDALADPRIGRLLDLLTHAASRRDMELRGYRTAESGTRIARDSARALAPSTSRLA